MFTDCHNRPLTGTARTLALLYVGVLLLGCCIGCSAAVTPSAPSAPVDVVTTIQYAINVPHMATLQTLVAQYGASVALSPVDAQQRFDYRADYAGSPNVYAGSVAPWGDTYRNTGIVIAPLSAASALTFTGADWPTLYGSTPNARYTWQGRFVYTEASR